MLIGSLGHSKKIIPTLKMLVRYVDRKLDCIMRVMLKRYTQEQISTALALLKATNNFHFSQIIELN